ncbi:1-acyl-sn-glycerol-3-phosphate acyltransferase [Actinokineospora spheciospongiae]|uniref:1-acyl-sn-glycerol-3-phosphate acyltransferase n=1 Tax=Actinokineospora spheciospongiae TaxID=909613 RepID=W7IK62_9PSEU|nr:lysophospholipid acyltransferase family protein [Actinokineospora spheciospongiae]EWC61240.1 1-acyl-sn-glycerol-3-phosphate acyltransferase [Actinokineospora spheciospongiae]PWW65389.1 1-acyl-sn-glycerol-3-phosphate acyltransferase [Actinokineospora spheciospongiae]
MFYRALRSVLSFLAKLFFRPTVVGANLVPTKGPVILAINHLAVIDSFVVPLMLSRKVAFLAKAEYFTATSLRGRLVGTLFRALGAIPVQRDNSRAALQSLEVAGAVLDRGDAFAIHPEGTRSLDGKLHRGRTGVAQLALEHGAPVVPVALVGTDRVQPAGTRLPRPRRIKVVFGEPLDFSRYAGLGNSLPIRRAVTDEVMYALMELSGQEYVDSYHKRPDAA